MTTTPDMVRARVVNSAGTFICHLPHTQGLRWLDEFNTGGAGSVDAHRYDDVEAKHPTVWNAGNHIIITVGGNDVFRLVLDAEAGYRIDDTTGERVDAWAGTGPLGVLNSGMCIPEYGWRPEATEERSFDYGSDTAIGDWFDASEWNTPVGKAVRSSWRWTYKKRHQPKGWPERKAQWIWWQNPDTTHTANETNYFVGSFTLTSARRVKMWVAGDDTLEFQVDGEVRATTGPGGWKKATTVVMYLSAGRHYVAAKVSNDPGTTGNQNRSGFICAIARMNGNGNVAAWLLRSKPSTFQVRRELTAAPGWFNGQILHQLVSEQITRGCAGHSGVTFGFTTSVDSEGVAWVGRHEMAITVGTQALDYIQQLVETGMDVSMTPGLVLNAYRSRGTDRSATVRIDQGTARRLPESGSELPGIRNAPFAKAKTGWVGQTSSSSITAVGRRETLISLGGSRSAAQTARVLASMLPDLATPPQTIEVVLSGAVGQKQPYAHFLVGDWISYRASGKTTWARYRVMSIGAEVSDAGHPTWTLKLYED